ncbi:hypothetical protein SAMN06264364_12022 [Quadrisphaera granulorum]|uniref:Copper(I)-binding protein n=1 Tax=Quadrisphaera granulorum TaxID=317664 RepID=A0A316A4L5_9ACTN|nr:hypothetical protein [Quadrisphaera granulorum]PWJ51744.1 hypothetical protein BXY45_12022 [Quadrisphaera granulorum]SZE97691.1 hypothetical protein SAMN06264364_12022 [Quadrisphaera granulorum]
MHLPRRALAASALALASLTTATGCTATNAQQTAEVYNPGAAAAATLGTVHVAGLFVATDGEGPASLVARIVNSGTEAVSVAIADASGSTGLTGTFTVDPASTYDVGPSGDDSVTVPSLDALPGQVVTMKVTAGSESTELAVPVLDGTLEQYAQYVPTATPTQTVAPSPTQEPSASQSPTTRVTGSPSATGPRTGSPAPSSSAPRTASPSPTESAAPAATETATSTPTPSES